MDMEESILRVEFAYLSNSFKQPRDNVIISKVYLDAIPLTQGEFLATFYNTCGLDFGICPSYYHSFPLSFLDKKYTTSNNIPVSYSLYDQLLHAYSVKCNDAAAAEITGIPNHVKIHLQRELFKVNTIVNHYIYQSAFSFDEMISGLMCSGKMEISSSMDDNVIVVFQLEYVYVSTLDTAVSVVFSYAVPLCGYISKKKVVTPRRREDSGMVLEGEDVVADADADADSDAYENMSDITTSDYDG